MNIDSSTKQSFQDKLVSFIASKRIILIVFLCLLVAGFVVLAVTSEINNRIDERSTILVENAQQKYDDWLNEVLSEKKILLENELIDSLDNIISDYSGKYAAQRAIYIKGLIYFNTKNWQPAYENFILLKDDFKESYLTSLALFFAGVCQEELNNTELALDTYIYIYNSYKTLPLLPNVIFSIGRLYDEQENYEKAEEYYNILKSDYNFSTWTKYAINRIIYLKSEGKL